MLSFISVNFILSNFNSLYKTNVYVKSQPAISAGWIRSLVSSKIEDSYTSIKTFVTASQIDDVWSSGEFSS